MLSSGLLIYRDMKDMGPDMVSTPLSCKQQVASSAASLRERQRRRHDDAADAGRSDRSSRGHPGAHCQLITTDKRSRGPRCFWRPPNPYGHLPSPIDKRAGVSCPKGKPGLFPQAFSNYSHIALSPVTLDFNCSHHSTPHTHTPIPDLNFFSLISKMNRLSRRYRNLLYLQKVFQTTKYLVIC